ncbi:MAG: M23 family metallopeptidase [Bacillota bacterium]
MDKKQIGSTIVLCGCFTLMAIGIGVAVRDTDEVAEAPPIVHSQELMPEYIEIKPVTMPTTPTVGETARTEAEVVAEETVAPPEAEVVVTEEKEEATAETTATEATATATTTAEAVTETATATAEVEVEDLVPVFSYPVVGEVVMPYSIETAIYDPTLDQYRTNNTVSMTAKEGSQVLSAEKGVVKEITKDEENGNSVVIEHSEGWVTTYSQLAGNMLVAVGQSVEKGQVVGEVAQPTIYTMALGEHLEFAIAKDGESKNPEDVLVK